MDGTILGAYLVVYDKINVFQIVASLNNFFFVLFNFGSYHTTNPDDNKLTWLHYI